jgi:glucose-6-phosphate 1-epimerase
VLLVTTGIDTASKQRVLLLSPAKMERKHKPSAIPLSPALPQPVIDLTNNVLTASLPSRDSVTINLYGATVTSWKLSNGSEQIFLSDSALLDGSKPIRGGIPLVFPVFGPPPKEGHATSKLPQHGFARNNYWDFMGSSRSENMAGKKGAGSSVKLDFGLGSGSLSEETKSKWPYEFGLVYSVELGGGRLETSMHVTNTGKESFDFQCLFHTYFRIKVSLTSSPNV